MKIQAFAKLNLSLDVLRRREDGYHDMCMVMQTISLSDTLTICREGEGLRVHTDLHYLPDDDRNLAAVAARTFWSHAAREEEPLHIQIEKRIPVCAGMAGGSSDAAAVLRALNGMYGDFFTEEELIRLGGYVGSDVPYCIMGGTALAEGRGEILTPLPALPPCFVVVCKPPFPVSTPELFRCIDCRRIRRRPDTEGMIHALTEGDLAEIARRMYNVFEDVLPAHRMSEITEIKSELISHGALGAAMSGTGPTVFGLFDREKAARFAYDALKARYTDTFLATPV